MSNTASETIERFLVSKVFVETNTGSTLYDPLRVLQVQERLEGMLERDLVQRSTTR